MKDEKLIESLEQWKSFYDDPDKVEYERKKVRLMMEKFGLSYDAAFVCMYLVSIQTIFFNWLEVAKETTERHRTLLEKAEKHMNGCEDGDEWKQD